MKAKTGDEHLAIVTLVIIVGFLWLLFRDPTQDTNGEFLTAVLTAVPVIFVTWIIGRRAEQATKHSNYITQSELCLKELECWAQEMFVCTMDHTNTDYKIVTEQAAAGIKYAFIRHMLTRHGKDSGAAVSMFPNVIVRGDAANQKDVDVWKKRFAKAVINYRQWYKILESLDNKGFPYKDSFAGLLNNELKVYGDNYSEENIIEKLKAWKITVNLI